MSDLADCLISWLDELFEFALERQPSITLAHARFSTKVTASREQLKVSRAVANYLTEEAVNARAEAISTRSSILASIQCRDLIEAKRRTKLFFRKLERASILEQQSADMQKQNRKMMLLLAHLEAVERRLFLLSTFLAPVPEFAASEHDDYGKLLTSIWEFVSGEIVSPSSTANECLVARFEQLERNSLQQYAHIDQKHAARLRSTLRKDLEKRIRTQVPILEKEYADQSERRFELLAKEKLHKEQGNAFESRLFSIKRKHCEKALLRNEVFQLLLRNASETLATPLTKKA